MTVIRQEQEQDYASIQNILRLCFHREGMREDFNEWVLVDKIRQCDGYIPELSLVAVEHQAVIGHIMFSQCWIGDQTSIALAPLAVHPDYQRQGIGSRLVEKGLELARLLGYTSSIVLGGSYYTRFGYRPIPSSIHIKDGLNEHLYITELQQGTIEALHGQIQYCSPFYDEQGNLI